MPGPQERRFAAYIEGLAKAAGHADRIVPLGAHSDDIEIGCGGTILRLVKEYPGCVIHWVVFSAVGEREAEAQRGAALFAGHHPYSSRKDAHQDHRLVAELTGNTFCDHLILEYEIPKYDGDMGQPAFFVPLEKEIYQQKVESRPLRCVDAILWKFSSPAAWSAMPLMATLKPSTAENSFY